MGLPLILIQDTYDDLALSLPISTIELIRFSIPKQFTNITEKKRIVHDSLGPRHEKLV